MAIAPAFLGVYPILVTPFDEWEDLDLPSLWRIVRFMAGVGANGVVVLGVLIAMVRAMRRGWMEEARSVYERVLPLIVFEPQPGIAVRKEIYRVRGLLGSGTVRHRGGGLGPGAGEQIRELLSRPLPGKDLAVSIG